jgi:hypothetical protein
MSRTKQFEYICKDQFEQLDHLKWCRRNLGSLGQSWNFFASDAGKKLIIEIYTHNEKGLLAYALTWG